MAKILMPIVKNWVTPSQIVFQAQIRREEGAFDLSDVIRSISDKMERRHLMCLVMKK